MKSCKVRLEGGAKPRSLYGGTISQGYNLTWILYHTDLQKLLPEGLLTKSLLSSIYHSYNVMHGRIVGGEGQKVSEKSSAQTWSHSCDCLSSGIGSS